MTENLARKTFYQIVQIMVDGMAAEAKKRIAPLITRAKKLLELHFYINNITGFSKRPAQRIVKRLRTKR